MNPKIKTALVNAGIIISVIVIWTFLGFYAIIGMAIGLAAGAFITLQMILKSKLLYGFRQLIRHSKN